MSKIPTAEEFLNIQDSYIKNKHVFPLGTGKIMQQNMIEFAKLHVKAALKEASENFKMKIKEDVYELDMNDDWMEVDKNSILNAYPLENIK